MLRWQLIPNVPVSKCSVRWTLLFVSSVILRTNSATEVPVKRTKFLHFIWRFKLPNKMVPYTQIFALSNGKLPSDCSLTPMWHWLQSLPRGVNSCQEKHPEHVCKCFTPRGTTTLPQCCSLSLQVVGLTCNEDLAWLGLVKNGLIWLQPWHSPKCKMLMASWVCHSQNGFWSHLYAWHVRKAQEYLPTKFTVLSTSFFILEDRK